MNKLLLTIFPIIALTACSSAPIVNEKKEDNPQINFVLDSVRLKGEEDFSFDVYIERPDLNQSELDYDASYGESLRPKLMYVSSVDDTDPQSGNMCYRPTAPHQCEVTLNPDHGETETFLLKVLFEDGTYASKEITVPIPEPLAIPEIISPDSVPADGSQFSIQFKDVGANIYVAEVMLCEPYGNDGINPCLDNDTYRMDKNEEGRWTMDRPYMTNNPTFDVEDGIVKISSGFILAMDDSIDYQVHALKEDFMPYKDGQTVPVFTEAWDFISFD